MKNIVVVDIDGTIADLTHRLKYIESNPKDWKSFFNECDKDKPIKEMIDLVYNLSKFYNILFITGRVKSSFKKTINWIEDNFPFGFGYDGILMREDGDKRDDYIVKIELARNAGIFDDIVFVLEDRTSVVNAWRELGIKCLQVADGNF